MSTEHSAVQASHSVRTRAFVTASSPGALQSLLMSTFLLHRVILGGFVHTDRSIAIDDVCGPHATMEVLQWSFGNCLRWHVASICQCYTNRFRWRRSSLGPASLLDSEQACCNMLIPWISTQPAAVGKRLIPERNTLHNLARA